jgi:p-cumate 2,3-dioxygenase alpha subunit
MGTPEVDGLIIDRPQASDFRIHRRAFCDENILALERDRVFDRCWLYAGHESEIPNPNDFVSRSVGGRPLILARDAKGTLQALFNRCVHRGAEVCRESRGNSRQFTCPYHYWVYGSDGALIGLPGNEAYPKEWEWKTKRLTPVPRVESYRGFVFVAYDPQIIALVEYLAGAREYLDLVCDQSDAGLEILPGTHDYGIGANWKFLAENSMDFYHAPKLHKRFFDYVRESGVHIDGSHREGRGRDLGNGHAVCEYSPPHSGRPIAFWVSAFPDSLKPKIEATRKKMESRHGAARARKITETNRLLLLFPNVTINDAVGITIRTFFPAAPDRMNVSAWSLAPREETEIERKIRLDNVLSFLGPGGFATPDDVEILQSCQKGLGIREVEWIESGRGMNRAEPLHDDELQMRAFWRRWHELLTLGAVRHPVSR